MTTSDDGLREIQLNGKQLVFLFMAVTVVSVVIFLCGVLVGRGVQGRVATAEPTAVQEVEPPPDASAAAPAAPPSGPTKPDDLAYPKRLAASGPDEERLVASSDGARKAPSTTSATPAPVAPVRRAAPGPLPGPGAAALPSADATLGKSPADPIPAEPKGDGIAIQVAALRGRAEADAVVARLKSKGYAAYLVPASAGQPPGFRVRVGKFKSRIEAEKVAARLEREEQFKPWITR